jgi:hypothetical protein
MQTLLCDMLPESGCRSEQSSYFLLRKPPESLDKAPPLSLAPARSILGRLLGFVGMTFA